MSRVRALVGPLVLSLLFAASIWGGLSNALDFATTETLGQRLVALMGMAYGLSSIAALYGVWRRTSWLLPVVVVWALLVVATATSAAAVYGGGVVGTLSACLGTVVVSAPVVWWVRRHGSLQPGQRSTEPT